MKKELEGLTLNEIAKKFYTDTRWKEIVKLRNEGKDDIADELMHKVHKDYGVDKYL